MAQVIPKIKWKFWKTIVRTLWKSDGGRRKMEIKREKVRNVIKYMIEKRKENKKRVSVDNE